MSSKRTNLVFRIIICLIFVGALSLSFIFESSIYRALNYEYVQNSQALTEAELVVHFIDVGQGDAIAISFPDNKTMLIDSGTRESRESLISYLNSNVLFNSLKIDYFLVTHPDEDHIGGSVAVFENFEISKFYRPLVYTEQEVQDDPSLVNVAIKDTIIFNDMISISKNEIDCEIDFFEPSEPSIVGEDWTIEFLSPISFPLPNTNSNNFSPMLMLFYQGVKILFTGDTQNEIEQEVLNAYSFDMEKLNADILKVGHHGSNTSSTAEFLSAVSPEFAVISVGRNNKFNHPKDEVLQRLNSVESEIFRTDDNGSVVFGLTDAGKIIVNYDYKERISLKVELWQIYLPTTVIGSALIMTIKKKNLKQKVKKALWE